MKYSDVKDFFTGQNYDRFLELYVEDFAIIEKYAQQFKNGIIDNKIECTKAINELTGVFMSINKIVQILNALKLNEELQYYVTRKREYENGEVLDNNDKPAKFVSASIEREAALEVAEYRRIRNIFHAYLDASIQGIQSVQSILKGITTENIVEKIS